VIVLTTKKQKEKDNEERLTKAMDILNGVAANSTTPRNIRKTVKDTTIALQEVDLSVSVRAANAISTLDDLSQDPNMPSYARVTLWQAVSILESIRE
tara:strand:- start:4293 stop:4583 length:291 start_codon:yes stop_codon:yes gene_type:complete